MLFVNSRKMKADFPRVQWRICHFFMFYLANAVVSRIFRLIRFILIFHTRADQIFLHGRLYSHGSSICPTMQNQLSPSPYNKRYTNRTWTAHAHSWICPSRTRKPVLGWIRHASSLSRRVYQGQVGAHHVHNWCA